MSLTDWFEILELLIFLLFIVVIIIIAIVEFFVKTTKKVVVKAKDVVKSIRPHKALINIANDPNNNELTYTTPHISKASNTNIQVPDDTIEWIDTQCKDNKKLYDTKGNIIVIGTPSPKIHTMATYDTSGNIIDNSSFKVKAVVKKVIFMDPEDKKDEEGKLEKLYEEGYISKSRYNSLIRDLKNK
ncbi:uncharacterized protein METZ01_LOCUS355883 [marine metagenome]|jgi:hypothetical protein|uniref:Uncharacterized protein n=1 Tax=marine metagenome TaxID=408172 RepID=A0A382RZA5_9ZZZZ|tara:strand:+ start:15 stop:572 length:558 start_codon:yes stop_codon:yes gene_type:complete